MTTPTDHRTTPKHPRHRRPEDARHGAPTEPLEGAATSPGGNGATTGEAAATKPRAGATTDEAAATKPRAGATTDEATATSPRATGVAVPRPDLDHRSGAERAARARRTPAGGLRQAALEQLAVAGGQLGAGFGNLLFALIAARLLAPAAFAELAAFLALYLLIHVPAGSLSAGSALAPELAARVRRRALAVGAGVALGLAVLSVPLGALLDLSPALLLAAAAAAPTAGLIALDRGRLYGLGRHSRVVGSLLAEPAVRLSLGVALTAVIGPVGGAVAVVVAGWAALAVAHLPARAVRAAPDRAPAGHVRPGAAVGAFLLLAVIQNQDVLLANAVLEGAEAGRFAVLSTLGGIAAFATTTVPLMLLSRAGEPGRDALRAAFAVATLLGLGAVGAVALSPERLVGDVFGARYAAVGATAVPYVLAMALLGVARVFVAHACAENKQRAAMALLAAVAALHVALIVILGDDAAGIATATLAATTTLTAGAAALTFWQGTTIPSPRRPTMPTLRRPTMPALPRPTMPGLPRPAILVEGPAAATRAAVGAMTRPDVLAVVGLVVAGLVIRVVATRGIWLDEATSIHQAQMPFGGLLESLRTTDVHPPLHHVVLWGTVRMFGTSELAARLPSLIAATALIPLLYAAGRDIYDRRAGLAAAALGTVAPFAVWYAQEARMYALFMVFALLAVWMQIRILRSAGTGSWLAFTLASAGLVYTQYFGLLVVAVQQLAFLVALRFRREQALTWAGWTALLALLLAPLAPFALDQFQANEAAGRGFQQVPSQAGGAVGGEGTTPGAYAAITNVVWGVLGYHSNATMTAIAALWPLALLLALALLGRGRSWPTLLIVASAAVPAAGLFLLGQAKPFVFEVRYFVGAVPLALLLIGRALTSWARRPAIVATACATAMVVLALGLADQQLNGSNPRTYDFRGAVNAIEDRARPGDVLVFTPEYLNHVIAYYEDGGLRARPLDEGLPEPRRGRKVFVLSSFLDKPQYRQQTADAVRRLDREHELVRRDSKPQIRTWEFR
jgi:dolichyl-phosphate-mannose-protein mannosyltransferase